MEITTILCIFGWVILLLGWILLALRNNKQNNSFIVIESEIKSLSNWATACFIISFVIFVANLILLSFLA